MTIRKKIFSATAFLAAASLTAFSFAPAQADESVAAYDPSVMAAGVMVQLAS
ncbi:MAG: hypothetical protein RL167_645, partial [Actinomycetota bacterium]